MVPHSVAEEIASYTVGLCKLNRRGDVEDAEPAGSGTLVTLGSMRGLLTAAHVLNNLPDHGEVGVVRFAGPSRRLQKQKIDMAHADKVVIHADKYGPQGPDLGILRLPPVNASNLQATNSFHNIVKWRDEMRAPNQPDPPYFDAVVGVIGQWTKDLPQQRTSTRRKEFELLFGVGEVVSKYTINEFDLCEFNVCFQDELPAPSSFGGVSGGGLWRIYVETGPDNQVKVREKRLVGVAFFEYAKHCELPTIICHGPKSVYEHLIDVAFERWPDWQTL